MPAVPQLRLLVRPSAVEKDVALAEELLAHLRSLERCVGVDVVAGDRKLCALDAADNRRRATNTRHSLVEPSSA